MAVVLCLVAVGCQVLIAIPLGITDVVLEHAFKKPPIHLATHPLAVGFVNIAAFGMAIWMGLLQNRLRFEQAISFGSFSGGQAAAVLLVVLGAGGVLSEIDNFVRWVLPIPRLLQDTFKDLFFQEGRLFSQLFLLVIVAPITEELLFRGLILRGLLRRYGPGTATLITALLFGAVHLNPWQFVSATLLGLAFGWFYLRTGSIGLCIIAHAMANGLAVLMTSLPVDIPGLTGQPNPHHVEFQPWWADLSALVILTTGGLLFLMLTKRPPVPGRSWSLRS